MNSFTDTIFLYWSDDDDAYVGHSLSTDQVGVGDRLVDALAETIRMIEHARAMHREDPEIELFCSAPVEVVELAKQSKELPKEIYEIAHKMVHGKWPEYLQGVEFGELLSDEEFNQLQFSAEIHTADC